MIMTVKAGYQLLSRRHTDRRRSISPGSPPPQLSQTSGRLKCSPGLICFLVLFLAVHCCSKAQVCTAEAAPCTESQGRLHRDAKERCIRAAPEPVPGVHMYHAGRLSLGPCQSWFLFCLPLSSASSHSNAITR